VVQVLAAAVLSSQFTAVGGEAGDGGSEMLTRAGAVIEDTMSSAVLRMASLKPQVVASVLRASIIVVAYSVSKLPIEAATASQSPSGHFTWYSNLIVVAPPVCNCRWVLIRVPATFRSELISPAAANSGSTCTR
jgi:hypothetical protein